MSVGPWFKCYADDLYLGLSNLNDEQVAAYMRVLCLLYITGKPLSLDDSTMGHRLNMNARRWKRIRDELIEAGKLYINSDGHLSNERCDKEWGERSPNKQGETIPKTIGKTPQKKPLKTRPLKEARNQKPEDNDKSLSSAHDIFEFWNSKAASIKSWTVHKKLTPKLRSAIEARISEYSTAEVLAFVEALSNQPWATQGKYSSSTLEYACRPATFAKHFDKLVQNGKPVDTKPKVSVLASIIPQAPTESTDELLAKRRAELQRERNHQMGGGQDRGDTPPHLPGMQPQTKKETPKVPQCNEEWFEDPRTLPPLPMELRA